MSEPSYELIPTSAMPRSVEDGLLKVKTVEAHIDPESRLILFTDPYSMGADRFRLLRVYFRALGEARGIKTLMVTSALPGEGKSTTALNLAIGLAERRGSTVVLVETDLRNPSLCHWLGIDPWPGLTQCIEDHSDPVSSIRRISPLGIYLLPAGDIATNPVELLNSERLPRIIQRLQSVADWIILDSPPVLPVPDVLAIRGNVDGCLWVVKANSSPRDLVKEAINQIGQDLVLSMVLNQAEIVEKSYPQYYGCTPTSLIRPGSW